MKLYSVNGGKISSVKSKPFKLEREIQTLVENNLNEFFDLEFVKSEFSLKSFRIDSLCFDKNNNSFVVIEYKNTKNYSVIDQGYTYLSLLLNNKSDFILEYNERMDKNLRRDDVDWSQSKVIFISPYYTDYQKNSVNFKDVPFELWEIKQFENNTFILNQHKVESNESISSTSKIGEDSVVSSVTREVKLYSEDFHLSNSRVKDECISIYNKFKERVLNFGDDIEIRPRKEYLGFIRKTNFVDVEFQSRNIKIFINLKKGELEDPKNICRDVSNIGHYGNGDYELKVDDKSDIDYVMFLVKQSYTSKI
jgi:predicted transport protein